MAVTQSTFSGPGGTGANGRTFAVTAVGTTATIASFQNVASGDTFLLVACSCGDVGGGLGTLTVHWDSAGTNQLMTSLGAIVSLGTGSNTLAAFGLVNPTSGTKTLKITSSGPDAGNPYVVGGISFQGSITSSVAAAIEGYATHNDGGTPSGTSSATTGVSIPTGDIAVAWHMDGNSWTSVSGTEIDIDADNPPLAGNFTSGAGSTITLTGTIGSNDNWAALIVGIKAATGGAALNWGFEMQSWWQLPSALPRFNLRGAAALLQRGDGIERTFIPPNIPSNMWLIQHWQPPFPSTRLRAAGSFTHKNDGIEKQFIPPNIPSNMWMPNLPNPLASQPTAYQRAAGIYRGDDGIEGTYYNWKNFGWEIQSPQPPNFLKTNQKIAALSHPEEGIEAKYVFVSGVTWGWEFQAGSLLSRYLPVGRTVPNSGDDGIQFPFINFHPYGWEVASYQPQHYRFEKVGSILRGDDGNQATLINFHPFGWEIQSPQPPHFKPEKSASITPWVNIDATYYNWQNFGWEIQSPQPPHTFFEKKGSILRGIDGVEGQFIRFFPFGWEVAPPQPPFYPKTNQKIGSLSQWEDGIEGPYIFVPPGFSPWAWEPNPFLPPHFKPEAKAASFLRGDEGIEFPFINWLNDGWEIQSWQPPHTFSEKRGAILRGIDGIEGKFVNFLPSGWEIQPPQPPFWLKTNLKYGALSHPEEGIEGKFVFIARNVDFNPIGWIIQPPQPPFYPTIRQRFGALSHPEEGIEGVYKFITPTIKNFEFLIKWRRRGRR